ncbi:hypothetical protein C7N43_35690 [Sphingobacteriales bacterium UPWRP_1]|nr:hypothetical protein C7N43_35690 [Sphingobacteriales bacterium UPWRP_1]
MAAAVLVVLNGVAWVDTIRKQISKIIRNVFILQQSAGYSCNLIPHRRHTNNQQIGLQVV